jgi:two-component system, chemotaxis family, sensor kinase CheA
VTFSSDQPAPELLEVFFESAEEILQGMNRAGLALEESPGDLENLRHVRRAVHTLKGDAAACGFRELSELAHRLEDVLTPEIAAKKVSEIASIVLAAADSFQEMLAAYRSNSLPPPADALRQVIQELLQSPAAPLATDSEVKLPWTEYERLLIGEACRQSEPVYQVVLHLNQDASQGLLAFELARKALESAGRLIALSPQRPLPSTKLIVIQAALATHKSPEWIKQRCSVPSVVDKLTVEAMDAPHPVKHDALQVLLEAEAQALSGTSTPLKCDEPIERRSEPRQKTPAPDRNGQTSSENSLRVDAARIDSVMDLVGELIIGKSMLQRAITDLEHRYPKEPLRVKLSDALSFQSRVLGELQKSVMKIRMVPVEQLFRRFPRIVRDVAKMRNKDIAFEIHGQNTDLDKSILDPLAEPIAHLLRNAADHGIEAPAARQAAGKTVRGTVRLGAYHEGDQVVIEVADDGGGLQREKIVTRALERGILTPDEASKLSHSDALQLIFRAGFSTATEITEISGRGVGLDVVRSVLEGLKGSVEVKSEAGRGTTFRLLVPLTLASIQALLFHVNGRLYAVPIASVIEITRVLDEDIHHIEHNEVFRLRNQILRLVRLDELGPPIAQQRSKRLFVIVIGSAERRFGLAVDSLMGEEELVIKALEDHLVTSSLISGASILGDGKVVLILNVAAVLSHFSKPGFVGAIT